MDYRHKQREGRLNPCYKDVANFKKFNFVPEV